MTRSPLLTHSCDETLALPPQLCGSIGYYARMAAYPKVIITDGMRWDKRYKSVHRHTIADPHGELTLTVPVSRPEGARRWCDIRLSTHGHWWTQHIRSLATAYGATPYFEYYIDRFARLFSPEAIERYVTITALDAALDAVVREALQLPSQVSHTDSPDARPTLTDFMLPHDVPHYRLTPAADATRLSILDLLFNMGPEAPFVLRDLIRANNL